MGNCLGRSRRGSRAEAKRMKREDRLRLERWQRHIETLLNAQASSIKKLRNEKNEALSEAGTLRIKLEQLEEVLSALCENNTDLHQSLDQLYMESSKSATKCRRYKKCVSDLQAEIERMQSMLVIREEMRDEELDPIREELQELADILSEIQARRNDARNKDFEQMVKEKWNEFKSIDGPQNGKTNFGGSTGSDVIDIHDVDLDDENDDRISIGSDGYFEDDVFYGSSYPLVR